MEHPSLFQQIKETGLSEEQTLLTLHIVGKYAKEKFPILEGNINAYLKQEFKQADPQLIEKLLPTKK
jgi:hypothetical protein